MDFGGPPPGFGGPGGPPGGAPGMPQMQLGKKKAKAGLPTLVNEKGTFLMGRKIINKFYQVYYITKTFCGQLLWFGSCLGLMFLFPFALEQMSEQQKLMYKIQLDMAGTGALDQMGGGQQPPVEVRPF